MPDHSSILPKTPTTAPAAAKDVMPVRGQLQNELEIQPLQKTSIQCKLAIGAPNDPLEREADAMADKVMRMPEQNFIQRKCSHCEDEEKLQRKPLVSFIQRKETSPGTFASDAVSNKINASKGSGSNLDSNTQSFMQSRFGVDFSDVKIHTGNESSQLNRELNAKAFTVGNDIYFNEGQYNPGSGEGKHLLAHELTHAVQQVSAKAISRKVLQTKAMDELKSHLDDGDEEESISLMGKLGDDEKAVVMNSREYKELATSAFGNKTMYRAMKSIRFNLYKSLEWMFDEGTSWEYVRDVIKLVKDGRDMVMADGWMKKQFIDVCNNKEMAEAVDLLGGSLLQKLTWMEDEGSDWGLVRKKITATTDKNERTALYGSRLMKGFFTSICDNDEMAEAVGLIGGTLLQKLTWMEDEGSDWGLVRKKIKATANPKEKTDLYSSTAMRNFFTDTCNDKEMTEAVTLLGGALDDKLRWLVAEEVSAKYYFDVISKTPDAELTGVSAATRKLIEKDLNKEDYNRVIQMLDGGLLKWGKDRISNDEKLYEKNSDGTWSLKTYGGDGLYDIEYSRTDIRIIVRVELKGEPVPLATQNLWIAGIHNRWTGKFHLEGPRRLPIVFMPIFTSNNPHHSLKVKNNPGMREDAGNWDLNTTGDTAAHEFGHWVGNNDEYRRTAADFLATVGRAPTPAELHAPSGGYTATDLIMSSGQGDAQIRHFMNFLIWLNKNRLPGEAAYRLVAGP